MKPAFTYYGSKSAMAKRIVKSLPKHDIYVEPFCGAAAVFFEKPRAEYLEVLSDANYWAVNALRCIRDYPDDLIEMMPTVEPSVELPQATGSSEKLRPYLPEGFGHDEWRQAIIDVRNDDRAGGVVENALITIRAWQFSYNSSPWAGAHSARQSIALAREVQSGAWEQKIRACHERLQGVTIELSDALRQIKGYAVPNTDTLFFCDPPYMKMEHGGGSRGAAYSGYGPNDPDLDFHERLIDNLVLHAKDAKFVLTSGKDELYESRLGAAGYGFLGGFGLEGRTPGRGGTGTAKHLIWASPNLVKPSVPMLI